MTLAALALLFAGFAAVAYLGARRAGRSPAGFLLAGRAVPVWMGTLAMTAAWVDGGYLLGTAEGVFKHSLPSGIQGGLFFGLSLVVGGLFFAPWLRRHGFTTMIDPFAERYGPRWAAVLMLPALFGELVWCGELLAAMGATVTALGDIPYAAAVCGTAAVVALYTAFGGLWSVTYTDVFQIAVVAAGLLLALPFALEGAGGLSSVWNAYHPPAGPWTPVEASRWADVSLMLLLGGVPWNCYVQRVLASPTEAAARRMSLSSGLLVCLLTLPPLLMGLAAFSFPWTGTQAATLQAEPSRVLPAVVRATMPPWAGWLGAAAIVGAITSSFSASLFSGATMFARNLWRAHGEVCTTRRALLGLAALAAALALRVRSVQALWFYTSEMVFVLLFPQLVAVVYDRKANRAGSAVAFFLSLTLRLSAAAFRYPPWFPSRLFAAAAGMAALPLVSRFTRRDPA